MSQKTAIKSLPLTTCKTYRIGLPAGVVKRYGRSQWELCEIFANGRGVRGMKLATIKHVIALLVL